MSVICTLIYPPGTLPPLYIPVYTPPAWSVRVQPVLDSTNVAVMIAGFYTSVLEVGYPRLLPGGNVLLSQPE